MYCLHVATSETDTPSASVVEMGVGSCEVKIAIERLVPQESLARATVRRPIGTGAALSRAAGLVHALSVRGLAFHFGSRKMLSTGWTSRDLYRRADHQRGACPLEVTSGARHIAIDGYRCQGLVNCPGGAVCFGYAAEFIAGCVALASVLSCNRSNAEVLVGDVSDRRGPRWTRKCWRRPSGCICAVMCYALSVTALPRVSRHGCLPE